ncbi:MAG TPA: tetratricopeptide repeat protein, partial [Pyrinomonadaceae bacterium]|nr:tetratricopeptide repeat protein [Pyrinomonadaceae bacterium]
SQVSELVARVKAAHPGDIALTEALAVGQSLINEKRFAEAAEVFGAVLDKNPTEPVALYGAALSAFNLGKTSEAESLARAAVAATTSGSSDVPSNKMSKEKTRATDALVLLAIVLAVRGDDPGALKSAQQAVRIAPDHFDAQFTLGRALYSVGDMSAAVKAFRVAVSLNPSDARALFFLGTTLERAGDLESALNTYRQLIAKRPNAAQGHLGVGTVLVRRGGTQMEEGIEALKRAVTLEPDLYEARVALGRALVSKGRAGESLEHLIRASELAPRNPEPQYQLSLAYRRLRQYDKAAEATAAVKRIHESRRASRAPRKSSET